MKDAREEAIPAPDRGAGSDNGWSYEHLLPHEVGTNGVRAIGHDCVIGARALESRSSLQRVCAGTRDLFGFEQVHFHKPWSFPQRILKHRRSDVDNSLCAGASRYAADPCRQIVGCRGGWSAGNRDVLERARPRELLDARDMPQPCPTVRLRPRPVNHGRGCACALHEADRDSCHAVHGGHFHRKFAFSNECFEYAARDASNGSDSETVGLELGKRSKHEGALPSGRDRLLRRRMDIAHSQAGDLARDVDRRVGVPDEQQSCAPEVLRLTQRIGWDRRRIGARVEACRELADASGAYASKSSVRRTLSGKCRFNATKRAGIRNLDCVAVSQSQPGRSYGHPVDGLGYLSRFG